MRSDPAWRSALVMPLSFSMVDESAPLVDSPLSSPPTSPFGSATDLTELDHHPPGTCDDQEPEPEPEPGPEPGPEPEPEPQVSPCHETVTRALWDACADV